MKRNIDPLVMEEDSGGEEEDKGDEEQRTAAWSRVPVRVFRGHSDAVSAARLCSSDSRLLSCSSDRTSILWDVESRQPLRKFDGVHGKTISDCSLISNSNRMVTVSWDKTMVAWDLETGQTLWKSDHAGLLTSCSASSDGRLLVCASDPQNSIYISDSASGKTLHHINGSTAAATPDGNSGGVFSAPGHHSSTITRCRFDPQSQRVATVSADRNIKLWDLLFLRTTVSVHSNHDNVVSDCCFTDNGHFLCTASWDKTLKLWDLQAEGFGSHGETTLKPLHKGSVSCCSFSADGNLLVSGSYDKTVALWEMSSLCPSLILKGHSDWVTDVSISTNRKLVASASKDWTVRLWDIEKMEDVPEVRRRRRSKRSETHILPCEQCDTPFPVSRLHTSERLTLCVFCRLKSASTYQPQPPTLM